MERRDLLKVAKYYRFLISEKKKYNRKIQKTRIDEKIQIFNDYLAITKKRLKKLKTQINEYEKETKTSITIEIDIYVRFKIIIF